MKKITSFPLLLSLLSTSTFAVNKPEQPKAEELLVIPITAGRSQLNVGGGASTYIFTGSDIENSSANDLTELLMSVPSLTIDNQGGRGALANVRIRGNQSNHVLVLIDGVRATSATTGTASIQYLPLSQLERVEVVKGPKSGVYGADALGGVIQIFTKKGKNIDSGYVDVGVGSHKSRDIAAGFNSGNDEYYYGVNVNRSETDGIDRKQNSTGADTDRDTFDEKGFSINIGRDAFSGVDFDLVYLVNQGNTQFDSGSLLDSTDFKNESVSFSSTYRLSSNVEGNVKLGYYKDDQETFGSNTSRFITRRDSATAYLNYTPSSDQSIIVGYDYYDDRVDSTANFTRNKRDNNASFIEYTLKNDRVNLQLAYRNDDNESYGKADSGNLSVSLPVSKNQWVGISYGEAIKSPTFNDLFFPFTDYGFGSTYEGNDSLVPEKSKSIDLNYVGEFSALLVEAAVYQTAITNLIEGTSSFDTVENVGKAELFGGELSLTNKGNYLSWGAAFSYVDAKNKDTDDRLTRRPRATARLFVNTKINKLSLSAAWLAEDGRKQTDTPNNTTAGYSLVDLGAAYSISTNQRIKLDIKNVFDKDYLLIDRISAFGRTTYNTEGRTFNLSYKYTF